MKEAARGEDRDGDEAVVALRPCHQQGRHRHLRNVKLGKAELTPEQFGGMQHRGHKLDCVRSNPAVDDWPCARIGRDPDAELQFHSSSPFHRGVLERATRQQPRGFITHHDLLLLVLDLYPRHDDATVALRGRAHRSDLDLAMNRVPDANRSKHLLLELEHGKPRALNHALAKQPLDEAIGQRRRYELPLDRPLLRAEGTVDENALEHPRYPGEQNEVGLGNSPVESPEPLARRQLLPGETEAERLHEISPFLAVSGGGSALRLRHSAQQKHGMVLSPKRFYPNCRASKAVWGWVGRLRRFCGEPTPGPRRH